MAIHLSVNLNKIALLRNSREGDFPNVEAYGKLALDAGANGLTVHPRPDQRHVRPEDTNTLSRLVKAYPGTEFNIEGNPTAPAIGSYPGLIELVRASRPDQCTFVPDSDGQKTSDHGFDLKKDTELVAPLIQQVQKLGVRVSLFMDPDLEQIQLAKDIGADRIELYTGPFAWAFEQSEAQGQAIFQIHREAASFAQSIGLGINAGHDLNLENMVLYKNLPGLQEVSIGHALTVDALNMGFTPAVQAYKKVCS